MSIGKGDVMTKRAWLLSLLFPVLSILGSMIFVVMYLVNGGFPVFIGILGLAGAGVFPIVLIVKNRLDLSKYFPVKIILFSVSAVVGTLFWTVFIGRVHSGVSILILPILMTAAEIVYAAPQKADRKTKICLALSSLAWGYLGFCIEMLVLLALF